MKREEGRGGGKKEEDTKIKKQFPMKK
jgi:hypothetical protein